MLDLGPIKERCAAAKKTHIVKVVLASADDVPALVAEVERLRAEADEVRAKAFEEAAKVVDDVFDAWMHAPTGIARPGCSDIAAALRAKAK